MKKYVNKNGQFTVTSVKDFTSGHWNVQQTIENLVVLSL
jgi:hypothetical protein